MFEHTGECFRILEPSIAYPDAVYTVQMTSRRDGEALHLAYISSDSSGDNYWIPESMIEWL